MNPKFNWNQFLKERKWIKEMQALGVLKKKEFGLELDKPLKKRWKNEK